MNSALFQAEHAYKLQGCHDVAGVDHCETWFQSVKGLRANFRQDQIVAEHEVEIAMPQQAHELLLCHGMAAEQKQLVPGWRGCAPSSRRCVHGRAVRPVRLSAESHAS